MAENDKPCDIFYQFFNISDEDSLYNGFKDILENFGKFKEASNIQKCLDERKVRKGSQTWPDLANFIYKQLPEELINIINENQELSTTYDSSGAHWQGNLFDIPWVAVYDSEKWNSVKEGYYPVYLFKGDLSGFYLSLALGTTPYYGGGSDIKKTSIPLLINFKNKFKKAILQYYNNVKENDFDLNDFSDEIDLGGEKYSKAAGFEYSTVFCKYYSAENLPTEETFRQDFINCLKLYEFTKEHNIFENIKGSDPSNNQIGPYSEGGEKEGGVEIMSKESNFDSFYDYLIKKEYLFDKETIENYLLSLKVKPFAILTGNSGTGKTKLSQLFAQYLNDAKYPNDNKLNSISTEVLVGKSADSNGWSLKRDDLKKLIPIDELENSFSVIIDGVPAKADLKLSPRLFYKPKENPSLNEHLLKLAGQDARQRVSLEILLDEPIINNMDEEYITFKTNHARLSEGFFGLGKKTVNSLLGLDKYEGTINVKFDDFESNEQITLNAMAGTADKELINHLMQLENLSDVEIKINKKDIANTFLDEASKGKKDILSWNRPMGETIFWCLPKKELHNFLPVKNKYTWNAIVDGIETTLNFWVHIVCISLDSSENEPLLEYLSKKDETDDLKIEVDLSTFEHHGKELDYGVTFISGVDEKIIEKSSNYKIIPVGANWTENRHIVGYYNVITNQYQQTPAYKLIKKADESSKPHFLILDEMNLSHVERYFADFLSAIESDEDIPLYGEEELPLPDNLFIIGTVNVDETTYMFSPKVLDRANVIEFETYSASDYMNNGFEVNPPSGNISYLENPIDVDGIRKKGIEDLKKYFRDVTIDGEPFWGILSSEINDFQEILKKSGFDFGFRVINEIVRFMVVAWKYENEQSEFTEWKRYFDACIKQKMLPKLHGSEKIIGETLDELYDKCLNSTIDTADMAKYPESYKKLKEMKKVLRKQRYVSFIN